MNGAVLKLDGWTNQPKPTSPKEEQGWTLITPEALREWEQT